MREKREVYFPEKPTKPPSGPVPEPPPTDFIGVEVWQYKALLRVARAAKGCLDEGDSAFYAFDELEVALKELPEGMLD